MNTAIRGEHQRLAEARCECDVRRIEVVEFGRLAPVGQVGRREHDTDTLPPEHHAIAVVDVEVRGIAVEATPNTYERFAVPAAVGQRLANGRHDTPRTAAGGGDPESVVSPRVIENVTCGPPRGGEGVGCESTAVVRSAERRSPLPIVEKPRASIVGRDAGGAIHHQHRKQHRIRGVERCGDERGAVVRADCEPAVGGDVKRARQWHVRDAGRRRAPAAARNRPTGWARPRRAAIGAPPYPAAGHLGKVISGSRDHDVVVEGCHYNIDGIQRREAVKVLKADPAIEGAKQTAALCGDHQSPCI